MKAKNITLKLHKNFWYAVEDGRLSDIQNSLLKNDKGTNNYYIEVPCKVDWCTTCQGTGKRSDWDVRGLDIDAMLYDEDGILNEDTHETYFGGSTDVNCDVCEGTKIENVVDMDACNDAQLSILKVNDSIYRDEAFDKAYSAAERAMGA